MVEKGLMEELIEEKVNSGYTSLKKYLKKGTVPVANVIEDMRQSGNYSEKQIQAVEHKAMAIGDMELTYDGAKSIFDTVREVVDARGHSDGQDYLRILDDFDPIEDADLIANVVFCLDEKVREYVRNNINILYRVLLDVGAKKRHGYSIPEKQRETPNKDVNVISTELEDLIAALPKEVFTGDREDQRRLHVILREKAGRESFYVFKNDEQKALGLLEAKISSSNNENVRIVYSQLRDTYQDYIDFEPIGANPNFVDPETGEKGVLPSLHQKIALHHILKEKRFGIFDGCGTGKTAIGALAAPLIEEQMRKEGRELRHVLVVGPNKAKKAWKKGLFGDEDERYFEDKADTVVVNGQKKTPAFLQKLEDTKWIVMNYEQLITEVDIDGEKRLFSDVLADMGMDYVIFDESHNIRTRRTKTIKGGPSQSAAARRLALSAEYFCPASGTPIPNTLKDYGVLYHLLNPTALPDPEGFEELYEKNPRILYTLFHEKTLRRTSEDINDGLDWEENERLFSLSDDELALYKHIVGEHGPATWIVQARKALVDPRLVDPLVIKRAGLEGKFDDVLPTRYNELIDSLEETALAENEPFVVFSAMFRDGVTQASNGTLKKRYVNEGDEAGYNNLGLQSLDVILGDELSKRLGRPVRIGVIDGLIEDVDERERIVEQLGVTLDGIVCTTETGGESLDMTKANHAYFLDEDYSPYTEDQAIPRLLRKGQTKKVKITHLRAVDGGGEIKTMDEVLRDYVEKKRVVTRMATDGVSLTYEEKKLFSDNSSEGIGEQVRRGLGGTSIDVYEAGVPELGAFTTKKRYSKKGFVTGHSAPFSFEMTDAQEIMRRIGNDKDCWKDPDFVQQYMDALKNLAVPVIHMAKVHDLVGRGLAGEIEFPSKVLSDGSGPSLLYGTYQLLEPVVTSAGFALPTVTDRDTSQPMLDAGSNPNQVLGCMTGKDSVFADGQFDMVDNESISLLRTPEDVHAHLLEANRILKPDGLLELIVKNIKFSDEFYTGLGRLGFDLLTKKNTGFGVDKNFSRALRKSIGPHYADRFAGKLADTYMLLARKIGTPEEVNPDDLWFERLVSVHYDGEARDASESRSIVTPRSRRKGGKPRRDKWKWNKADVEEDVRPVAEKIKSRRNE